MKVTDLEEFAKNQIWRPYWPMHAEAETTDDGHWRDFDEWWRETRPNLRTTLEMLRLRPDVRKAVVNRLSRIGVRFPSYIKHPLVTDMRDWLDAHRKEQNDA